MGNWTLTSTSPCPHLIFSKNSRPPWILLSTEGLPKHPARSTSLLSCSNPCVRRVASRTSLQKVVGELLEKKPTPRPHPSHGLVLSQHTPLLSGFSHWQKPFKLVWYRLSRGTATAMSVACGVRTTWSRKSRKAARTTRGLPF